MNIPDTAFVPCPAISFRNRKASKCLECPHFEGIVDAAPGKEIAAFESKYRIGCGHVIARRMIAVEGE